MFIFEDVADYRSREDLIRQYVSMRHKRLSGFAVLVLKSFFIFLRATYHGLKRCVSSRLTDRPIVAEPVVHESPKIVQ